MNTDIIAGKWTQLKGTLKARWGQLTDDDFKVLQGDAQYLSGKLQERYGWDRDQADKAVSEFEHELRKQDKH
ncbi:CsbD family protein [Xanthomonas massiliensis]|uniref:CsbD family protein n=1 Tax=Xanthomonas massiliensis TaxID=1720302 RepID=UPI000825732E|nr:CsbD family protein [Xanthomonas massiliensis]